MVSRAPTIENRLLRRQCVACGYDGSLLRGGQATRCARCACDLRQRPARSYAEMEGLVGHPLDRRRQPEGGEEQLVYRWVAFLFLTMLAVVGMVYLAVAAAAA